MTTLPTQLTYRKSVAVAVFAQLAILLAGAVYYYRERMLFLDAAGISFHIINSGQLQIQEKRYGSFFTQLFPLIAAKCHLSLAGILILYSASFVLLFILAAFLLYRMRQHALLVLLGCYCTLIAASTWYWTNNEIHQGIAWMFIAFGGLFYSTEKQWSPWVTGILFLPIIFLAIFTHPLVLAVTAFLWVYYLIDYSKQKTSLIAKGVLTILLGAVIFIKVKLSQGQSYDSAKMANLFDIKFITAVKAACNTMGLTFLKNCLTQFWLLPLLFLAGCATLAIKRKYMLLSLTVGGTLAYYVLLCITYDSYLPFYIESEWMPLAIIALLPFATYTLPTLKPVHAGFLLGLVFAIRLVYIGAEAPAFTNRLRYMDRLMDNMQRKNISKVIIPLSKNVDDSLIMSWSLPNETMMLSALEHRSPQLTIMSHSLESLPADYTHDKTTFANMWDYLPASKLNQQYFHLDTTQPYRVLSYDELAH